MSKRKDKRDYEEDIMYFTKKIKRLKKKMKKTKGVVIAESDGSDEGNRQASPVEEIVSDWLNEVEEDNTQLEQTEPTPQSVEILQSAAAGAPLTTDNITEKNQAEEEELKEILDILGEDPADNNKYGPEIRQELAGRLQHIATKGLSKELRKQLLEKYLIPKNCTYIEAPKLNPEMKAAIPESIAKRDKGIEVKQKQVACAISCLTESISTLLSNKERDNKLLKGLMDAVRLLCDIQHADSMTRRNFILFTLKKEMKEHLCLTDVDSMLFGSNLAETLKSAKAVNKSGIELKADQQFNRQTTNYKKGKPGMGMKSLNQRAPPTVTRRPMGAANRGYQAPRAPPPQTQHGRTSKTSSHRPPQTATYRRPQ